MITPLMQDDNILTKNQLTIYKRYIIVSLPVAKEVQNMKEITIQIREYLYAFYAQIGQQANIPTEQVLYDALFKLAGELSLNALKNK